MLKAINHVPEIAVHFNDGGDAPVVIIFVDDYQYTMNSEHIPLNRREWYASVLTRHIVEIDRRAREETRRSYQGALAFLSTGKGDWPSFQPKGNNH